MADEPAVVGADVINQATLADAYDFIKSVLERNELRATAAFVTCFAAGPEGSCQPSRAIGPAFSDSDACVFRLTISEQSDEPLRG